MYGVNTNAMRLHFERFISVLNSNWFNRLNSNTYCFFTLPHLTDILCGRNRFFNEKCHGFKLNLGCNNGKWGM